MTYSWQLVARRLAARMRHHAECSDHPADDPDPGCPFCSDRSAYELFLVKDTLAEAKRRAREGGVTPQRSRRTDVEIVSVRQLLEDSAGTQPVDIFVEGFHGDPA